jgi:adsorption protein B
MIELAIEVLARELTLFAAVGLLLGGIDDIAIDLIWIGRTLWRRATIYARVDRARADTLTAPDAPGRIAVFVPAWREHAVIAAMLRTALTRFQHDDYRIYVGCYPNDPDTPAIVRAIMAADRRVRIAMCSDPGPTTKADCLNAIWMQLQRDEQADGVFAKAIVLHDAEDVVHPAELRIVDRLIERVDLVQLPVLPLQDRTSRWVGGSYADEFAESHGKSLVVREALGAGVPSAGVGCGISRAVLQRMAVANDGCPFDPGSLTEDYELGLRVAEAGGRSIFVRLPAGPARPVVAVRAYFPGTLGKAVRQKARWNVGIALSGWDRLGWHGGLAEHWMRLRDRRAPLAAIVLFAGYLAVTLQIALIVNGTVTERGVDPFPPALTLLLWVNTVMLGWRIAMRIAFVGAAYGWREGLRAAPRMAVSNVVTILSCALAVRQYLAMRRAGLVAWDKTSHAFPDILPAV